MIDFGKHDTGAAGVNESLDTMSAAGGDDILRADKIDVAEEFPGAPKAGETGGVEDGVNTFDGFVDRGGISDIAANDFDFGR